MGLGTRYLPYAAVEPAGRTPKEALAARSHWTPLLEAFNGDKAALRASRPVFTDATIDRYTISVKASQPAGLTQLGPYRRFTVMTGQRGPGLGARIDKPVYDLKEDIEKFSTIAAFIRRFPQEGDWEGPLTVSKQNAAMVEVLLRQIDAVGAAGGAATTASGLAPSRGATTAPLGPRRTSGAGHRTAAARAPPRCPPCGGQVEPGAPACPTCRQPLGWH